MKRFFKFVGRKALPKVLSVAATAIPGSGIARTVVVGAINGVSNKLLNKNDRDQLKKKSESQSNKNG